MGLCLCQGVGRILGARALLRNSTACFYCTTLYTLAQRISELTASSSEIVLVPYEQAYGPGFDAMRRRVPDISLAFALLGWKPLRTPHEIVLEFLALSLRSPSHEPIQSEVAS